MSDPELTVMTRDSERITKSRSNASFLTIFQKGETRIEAFLGKEDCLEAASESDIEGLSFISMTE